MDRLFSLVGMKDRKGAVARDTKTDYVSTAASSFLEHDLDETKKDPVRPQVRVSAPVRMEGYFVEKCNSVPITRYVTFFTTHLRVAGTKRH